jgi:anaerobic ribonucleoside-triphosphate reductase activating protein
MLDFQAGKRIPVDVLLRRLLKLDPLTINGVTVSGGEPFSQPARLIELFTGLREHRPDWSIQIYSGYTIAEIRASGDKRAELLQHVDILVDGLFMQEIPQTHAFAGSGNQVVHHLTPRGLALKPEMDAAKLAQVNYGIGNGTFDMLVGVVQDEPRNAIIDLLHETQDT